MSSLLRLPLSIRVCIAPKYLDQLRIARLRNVDEAQRRGYVTAGTVTKASLAWRRRRNAFSGQRRRFLQRTSRSMGQLDLVPAPINPEAISRDGLEPSTPADDPTEQYSNDDDTSSDTERIMTLEYVKKHMDLPKPSDYPHLPPEDFRPCRISVPLNAACLKKKIKFKISKTFKSTQRRDITTFECVLSVHMEGILSTDFTGHGSNKASASEAAWLQLSSELHTSGALPQLLAETPKKEPIPYSAEELEAASSKPAAETLQELKKRAPYADPRLFAINTISSYLHNACGRAGLSMKSEGQSLVIMPGRIKYDIDLEIPGLLPNNMTSTGYGETAKEAKNLAWVNMLEKLHSDGSLYKLLRPPKQEDEVTSVEDPNVELEASVDDAEDLELVNIDPFTMKVEKDAKLEIYTYAAAFGLTPTFDAKFVEPRTRREKLAKGSKHIVQASIALPELGIRVASAAHDVTTAEVGAAIEFKRKAEELRIQSDSTDRRALQLPGFDMLTVDSARRFLDFCREYNSHFDMEAEIVKVAGLHHTSVRIAVNGEQLSTPAIMRTKKDAMAVAYLLASLHIAKANPERLASFADALSKPRVNQTLHATVSTSVIDMMREGLIRARRGGLPDVREVLEAENTGLGATTAVRRRPLGKRERESASERLLESRRYFELDPGLEHLRTSRASLPMSKQKSQVIDTVSGQTYSIIIGATGSGKTTQVPQIILDDAIERGEGGFCDIVCTQPRRIAATSIAQRVAAERNEPLGETVGYQVRFNTKLPRPGGSITYCTTGILLAQLKSDPDGVFDRVSHLVVDEVHERDLQIDFLLVILKKAIARRQAGGRSVPKVILMSATLDRKLFADYLAQHDPSGKVICPALSVPGRTFPVKERYLADIVDGMQGTHKAEFEALMQIDNGTSGEFLAAETRFASGQRSNTKGATIDWKRSINTIEGDAADRDGEKEESMVPVALLAATIAHVCKTSTDDGAILAFLPGLSEILVTEALLLQQPIFGVDFNDAARFKILPLHSQVAPEEQSKVLHIPASGCRKIILSTNIAETSITVPDVKHVVDTGKLRESRYDHIRRITKLQTVWESNSNARQRAGRAGRVQDGNYYALYTRERREAMPAAGLAELLRSDLQSICLSIKAQGFQESVSTFLGQAIEPPPQRGVDAAVDNLKAIEAFTADEHLTALGLVLSKLPVHPTLGKMIILGVIFRCLHPMLVLGSMDSERSLFNSPPHARGAAKSAQKVFNKHGSDQLAYLEAFTMLKSAMERSGVGSAYDVARSHHLSMGAFRWIDSTAQQILQHLVEAELVPDTPGPQYGGPALNVHSDNPLLIKCLLLAGTYPNIGVKGPGKTLAYRTVNADLVKIHPGSVNYVRRAESKEDRVYTFSTLARNVAGTQLFMRDSTLITPLMLILFGGTLELEETKRLVMDGWLPIRLETTQDAEYANKLVLEFRKGLDRVLNNAFKSLSGSGGGSLLEDEVRDEFTSNVAELLEERWSMRQPDFA